MAHSSETASGSAGKRSRFVHAHSAKLSADMARRRTKIVATIGPASRDPETLVRLVEAGMDVARFNFSHGTRELHAENAERVRAAANRVGRQVAILQDLPGPKLRIGALRDDIVELKPGERLRLLCGSDRARRRDADVGLLAGAGRGRRSRRRDLPGRRRDPPARRRGARRRRRGRDDRRGRRLGRDPPGAQHPGLDPRPAGGARGGPRHAAFRRVDRGRHRGAVVRALGRGRRDRAWPYATAAGGQDREAAGGARTPRRSSAPPTR